ncbi:MAG: UTP--glucose-1-phosphate uridylyltransferase [Clostridia bacterium]
MINSVKKAVILAAGFGTRFLPFTKAVSKTMLPIVDTPAIQVVVEEAVKSGISEILIIIGVNSSSIQNHFSPNPMLETRISGNAEAMNAISSLTKYNIQFAFQVNLNGTAGAVLLSKKFVGNEPFLLMFADDVMFAEPKPVSLQLIETFEKTGCSVVGVQNVTREEAPKYGVIEFNEKNGKEHTICGITEKPKFEEVKSTLVSLGRFVMKSNYFSFLEKVEQGKNGEYNSSDALSNLSKSEKVIAYDFDGTRYDTGDKFGYLRAVVEFSLRNEKLAPKMKNFIVSLADKIKNENK